MTKNIKNKIRGFTLIEVVIALIINILVIGLLAGTLVIAKKSEVYTPKENKIAFGYIQLRNFLKSNGGFAIRDDKNLSNQNRVTLIKFNPDKKGQKKTYIIEKYQDMLRITGQTYGHMPLLINIENCSFKNTSDQFLMIITEKDGKKSELYFSTNKQEKDFESTTKREHNN